MPRIMIFKLFMVIVQNLGEGVNEWTFIWEIGGVAGEITVALKKDEIRVSRGRKESTVSEVAAGY